MTFNGNRAFHPSIDAEPNSAQLSTSDSSAPKSLSPSAAIAEDLAQLLAIFPDAIRHALAHHSQSSQLIEVILDLGRPPEARFPTGSDHLMDVPVSREDLDHCIARVGEFSGDNRAGIERTLHRISAIRNRQGQIIGLTCRVGRAIFGTIGMIRDLVETGQSILMLGRPGVGKTTALREIARVLADELHKRVVIIDTSNEIAGDGDIPHPALGRARRMQVASPELQHQVMIEAVENHTPEVIVIDEIGTELEALAARTIAERGVQLVGTAHGNRIENLVKNPTLSDLVGGIQSVTLGDDEARRRGSQKSVLERKAPPTFDIAVEMLERQRWVVHEDVSVTVDTLLRGLQPIQQIRTVDAEGNIDISEQRPSPPIVTTSKNRRLPFSRSETPPINHDQTIVGGWRTSGQMRPVAQTETTTRRSPRSANLNTNLQASRNGQLTAPSADHYQFDQLLNASLAAEADNQLFGEPAMLGPNGEDMPLHVYPYAISRNLLDQVIRTLNLPIVLTKDLDSADAILALRSHLKNHSKLRHIAKHRQLAIHAVKSNSMPHVLRAMKRLLHIDDPTGVDEPVNLDLFSRSGDEDEIEALEETRLAVEQIVIPKGQPVELLPRSAKVRKMQHELVEHYRLKSSSFGDEPNRRIRIYPA